MTEHKFTDEEIIKALECCVAEGCPACDECPFDGVCCDGTNKMLNNALDLINRQKAEVAYWMDAAANAKKEAIGSFADRLKKYYASLNGKKAAGCVEYHVDQIAKEMMGEQT